MKHIRSLAFAGTLLLWLGSAQAQVISPEAQRQPGSNAAAGALSETRAAGDNGSRRQELSGLDVGNQGSASVNIERALPPKANERDPRRPPAALDGDRGIDTREGLLARPSTEFSRYASKVVGQTLPVFGTDFFSRRSPESMLATPAVPPDYIVNAGDELLVQITGSFDAELRQQVRRGGDISLPRVGAVRVAGVQAADLSAFVQARLETQFRNVQVSVSFVALRGMRVFVTGFVTRPGPHVVDSLSTLTGAIAAAGGPAEGGSYRAAELWRKGRKKASFDLYQFLVLGDSAGDESLTADDVIRVLPASPFQVAITGSVNRPGVYELLAGESLETLLQFAGGLNPLADRQRMAAVELDANGQRKLTELSMASPGTLRPSPGAVLNVFSAATLNQAIRATSKIVHVEGEVRQPGSYVLPANASLDDALARAGGITAEAYIRNLALLRPELAIDQQALLQRSLDELEKSMFEATNNSVGYGGDVAQASNLIAANTRAYIERLRQFKPTGRLVMSKIELDQGPGLILMNGDRIVVPPRPDSVSIFGAVYGEGSYKSSRPTSLPELLKAAGGARPGADESAIVVLRGDGSFTSLRRGMFDFKPLPEVEPGDTVFVPTDTQRGRFWVVMRDIGTMLYQFGIGAAAFKVLN